ncbi:MAG: hypothetical protein WC358_08200, partial [Ignavibacteria bacterium]
MSNPSKFSIIAFIVLCYFFNISIAQEMRREGNEKYSKVRIFTTSDNDFKKIGNAGLFLDGGIYKKGLCFETWISESEMEMLKKSGVPFEITIDDWIKYYTEMQRINYISPNVALTDAYTIS